MNSIPCFSAKSLNVLRIWRSGNPAASITPEEDEAFHRAEKVLSFYARLLYQLPPRRYQLSPKARRHLNLWFRVHQKEALDPSSPSVISAMLGKTSANALRLAGLLHLVWTKGDSASEISLDLMQAATAMVDQCVSETREFHQPLESIIATELMRHVHSLSWENDVLKQDLITWQDAKNKGSKRIRDAGAKGFKKAIAALEEMGLGECLQAGSSPAFRARRPWP